jgi:hypothetical protein
MSSGFAPTLVLKGKRVEKSREEARCASLRASLRRMCGTRSRRLLLLLVRCRAAPRR